MTAEENMKAGSNPGLFALLSRFRHSGAAARQNGEAILRGKG
jgi:hypothetical protein